MINKRRLRAELLEARLVPSTYYLHQGGNLQSAIDSAHPGDYIMLDPGATFRGPITLDAKSNPGQQWITIETNNFPLGSGVRVSPNNAPSMAEILAPSYSPAIQTQPHANFYVLRGLDILPVNSSAVVDTLVTIGDGSSKQSSISQLPNNIEIDQCFIHGWDGQTIKRGVGLNDGGAGSKTGVYDSYISDIKLIGQDSQAIAGWNGAGPYTIQNNYLEAAGENVMFGGSWSYIQQVPSNITIVNNTFSKPLSWNPNDPSFAGTTYTVKNLFELKNAQNVTIDHNTLQNNWAGAQDGHAIVLTPRGAQDGGSWVTVSNVTFTHNLLQNVAQGFNILGSDDSSASQVATNILIQDNVFKHVGGQNFTVQLGQNGGTRSLVIDHNTMPGAYTDLVVSGVHHGFQFTNNLMEQGMYGMLVDGLGAGPAALAKAFPDGVISGNVIVGANPKLYPLGNLFPPTWSQGLLLPGVGARGTNGDPGNNANSGNPSPLAAGTAGVAYSQALTASVGTGGPYSFTLTNGALPAGFTLSASGVLSGRTTLAGTYNFTITASTGSFTSSQTYLLIIDPAAAATLLLSGFPSSITAGVAFSFTVTAKDAFGNVATGYTGTIHFSSSDSQATVPGKTTLTKGTGTLSATLRTAGTRSLTAADTVMPILTATQAGISVISAVGLHFVIAGPSSVNVFNPFDITVMVEDAFGNIATGYRGTVTFSSTDASAWVSLPDPYTFTASDSGVHTFTDLRLMTAGQQTISLLDRTNNNDRGNFVVTVLPFGREGDDG